MFTAKLCALYHAVLYIHHQSWQCHFLCIDTLSALQNLHSYTTSLPVIKEILHQVSTISKAIKSVVLDLDT
jgi:hypothetical protein